MNVAWRIGTLFVQLAVLALATYLVEGRLYSGEVWFLAGLLSVALNPQLLEPFYPKRGGVVGNALVALILVAAVSFDRIPLGREIALWSFGAIFVVGIVAVIPFTREWLTRVNRGARIVTRPASAMVIYSAVFWLALLEREPVTAVSFWILAGAWILLVFLKQTNWQRLFNAVSGRPVECTPQSLIGPSQLLVVGPHIPPVGSTVRLSGPKISSDATVVTRIQRTKDIWARLYVHEAEVCDALVELPSLSISTRPSPEPGVVGVVDAGTTDSRLEFQALCVLEIGQVVSVTTGRKDVLYQLVSARSDEARTKGGSHLVVGGSASQIGWLDPATRRLSRHRWTPSLAAPVRAVTAAKGLGTEPDSWIRVGNVIGTDIPVYLDWNAACEGHLAIIGMTKMGKTTFAVRLARALGESHHVLVMDQTGEYVNKRGFPACSTPIDWTTPGVSIWEPDQGSSKAIPTMAYQCLEKITKVAAAEYEKGQPTRRILLIDEAHQFVPEPAGLGFNVPGREDAYRFGTLMMQVRKYGISIILISQRTAVVAKSALSQCENVMAFRSVDQTGLDYLEAIAGGEVRRLLPQLAHGEALVFGPAVSSENPVAVSVAYEPGAE